VLRLPTSGAIALNEQQAQTPPLLLKVLLLLLPLPLMMMQQVSRQPLLGISMISVTSCVVMSLLARSRRRLECVLYLAALSSAAVRMQGWMWWLHLQQRWNVQVEVVVKKPQLPGPALVWEWNPAQQQQK
jgi:hypothetical protein